MASTSTSDIEKITPPTTSTSDIEKTTPPAAAEVVVSESNAAGNAKPLDERTIRGVKWFLAYSSLLSTVLFYALDTTIVADIQPSILETFGETEKLPWMGVALFLGALTILPTGRAYGVFNVKWLFLSVVVVFEVGSALAGAAPKMNAFIVGRVIQGAGASGCYSGAITYISMTTTQRERPLYLSGIVATWSLGSVVGPVIGGAFAQSSATWRWAFYINLVVAAVTAPALILCLPNIDPAPNLNFKEKLRTQDWICIVVFLAGSACFTMALTFGGIVYPFNSGPEITLWTIAGVLLIAFILAAIYHPMIPQQYRLYPIHLWKSLDLTILQFSILVNAGCMVTTLYYTPLIFQFTRGDGPLLAGVRLLPFLSGMIVFSILNGALMPRLGYVMPWYVLGTALILIGAALMSKIDASTSESRLYGYTVLIGSGCGSFFTAGFSVVQQLVPVDELSNAISFMAFGQTMGQIAILSLGGSLFQNIGLQRLRQLLPDASAEEVTQLTTGIHSSTFEGLNHDQQDQVVQLVTLAIRNVFTLMAAASGLALIASLFLTRRKVYK